MNMESLLTKYGYTPDKEGIGKRLDAIAANIDNVTTPDVLNTCMSIMDLTTLKNEDTPASVAKLAGKVNSFKVDYPSYPLPASICVFSNLASVVKDTLDDKSVHVTAVSGCFPTSQSFIEVKVKECEMAVAAGADEIDIVLALNSFMAGDFESSRKEIRAMRAAVDKAASSLGKKVVLKVILETGLLVTPERIAEASFLDISSRHPPERSASTPLRWPRTSCANASRPSVKKQEGKSVSRPLEEYPRLKTRWGTTPL